MYNLIVYICTKHCYLTAVHCMLDNKYSANIRFLAQGQIVEIIDGTKQRRFKDANKKAENNSTLHVPCFLSNQDTPWHVIF